MVYLLTERQAILLVENAALFVHSVSMVHYVFSASVVFIRPISTRHCVPWQRSKAEKFAQQFSRIYRSQSTINASKMGFTELTNPHKASNLPGFVEVFNCWFYLSLVSLAYALKWLIQTGDTSEWRYNKSNTTVNLEKIVHNKSYWMCTPKKQDAVLPQILKKPRRNLSFLIYVHITYQFDYVCHLLTRVTWVVLEISQFRYFTFR